MTQKRLQWIFALVTALAGAVVLYAQNPVSIAQVGTTAVGTTVPVSGTVTANMGTVTADPFGANADAASATGSMSAKLRFIAGTGIPITALPANASVNINQIVGSTPSATNPLPTRLSDGSSFITQDTQLTHDGALTVGSTTGGAFFGRASAAAPTDVSADNDAVLPWFLRSGATVIQQAYAGILALTGNGVTGTGSPRVTIASDNTPFATKTDQTTHGTTDLVAADVTKLGGQSINAGNGASSTGTARVTLASDSTGVVAPIATAVAGNGTTTYFLTSAASTNSTSVKASAGNLYAIHLTNTTTTNYFLRLYDAASAPTCSSATNFLETIPALGAAANGGINGRVNHVPQAFATGIAFCLTGGGSSTDNTNAATGVYLTLEYK